MLGILLCLQLGKHIKLEVLCTVLQSWSGTGFLSFLGDSTPLHLISWNAFLHFSSNYVFSLFQRLQQH